MADQTFRNVDYTDRELLSVIQKAGGDHGATTDEIAMALGITVNGNKNKTPSMRISPRLSWMHRYGFLDRVDGEGSSIPFGQSYKDSMWVLTPIGQALLKGKLTKSVESALEKMDPGSHLMLMRSLTRRAIVQARQEVAHAMRREYQHQVAQRKSKLP